MADFTVYLLRDVVQHPDQAIEGAPSRHDVVDGGASLGALFIQKRPPKTPKWARLFYAYISPADLGKVQSTGALYIVQAAGRFFAVAFGHGRHLLKPGITEERFGLLVVLNAARANEL